MYVFPSLIQVLLSSCKNAFLIGAVVRDCMRVPAVNPVSRGRATATTFSWLNFGLKTCQCAALAAAMDEDSLNGVLDCALDYAGIDPAI